MGFKRKAISSFLVSAGFLVGSFVLPLVPCQISPLVPNPHTQWILCSLNPDNGSALNSVKEYWGYTTSLTDAYFLTLILVFVVSLLLLSYVTRKKK